MKDWLRQRLQAQLEAPARKVPQLAASVSFQRGNEIWAETITPAETRDVSVRSDCRFLIQSLTKSFTAAVILRLVAAGKLQLDAPVAQWLTSVPHASRISIRQCLQHTSGLPDYGSLKDYHDAIRQGSTPWSFQEFLDRTRAETLCFEPGKGWGYSNIGYMILRRLIEEVCGRSFDDMIMTEICQPLGLTQTFIVRDRKDLRALTAGYRIDFAADGPAVDVRDVYDPGWIATGVAASTASDVVRFYHQLFSGEVLPSDLLDGMCSTMRAAPSHPRFVTPSYGLGLMADPDSHYGAMYGHSGGGPGYSAAAYHFASLQRNPVTVAVLLNTENPDIAEIMMLATVEAQAEA